MPHYPNEIEYSEKYTDSYYEYRHVVLPKEIYKKIAHKGRLLT
jgi:cyclin-dependent kinase regulatory subunit CKS1